jgi:hypothetical protein
VNELAKSLYAELLKGIAEEIPNFRISTRHRLVYKIHQELILCGFLLDLSGLEKGAFYLTAFVQPLYVPCDYIVLSYGKRLEEKEKGANRGVTRRKISQENQTIITEGVLQSIRLEGLAFLERINTIRKFAEVAEGKPGTLQNPFGWHDSNPNLIEVRAYSWVLLGDEGFSKRDLLYLTQKFSANRDWEKKLQERAARVSQLMELSKDNAQSLLREWAKQSTASLGLDSRS